VELGGHRGGFVGWNKERKKDKLEDKKEDKLALNG
jgi:hypothetical protein